MANKTILSIPVDATAFDAFLAKFEGYQKELDAQPEKWRAIGEEMSKAGFNGGQGSGGGASADLGKVADTLKESLGLAAANAVLLAEALGKAGKAQAQLEKHVDKTEKTMSRFKKLAMGAGRGAWGLGKAAMKFGAVLGGAGAGFGLYEMLNLPGYVTRLGMTAGGLGISPGAYSAYNIGMTGMIQNPAQVQQGLFGLQHNIQAMAPIAGMMGINPNEDLESLKKDMFIHLPDLLARYPKNIQGMMYQQLGLSATGESLQDILRPDVMKMTDAQRAAYYDKEVAGRKKQLDMNDKTIANWEKLNRTLQTSEATIKSALINALAPFGDKIGELSKTISDDLVAFIKAVFDPLQRQKWEKEFSDIYQGLKGFANSLGWVANKLGWIPARKNQNAPDTGAIQEWGWQDGKYQKLPPGDHSIAEILGFKSIPQKVPGSMMIRAGQDIRYLVSQGVPEATAEAMIANAMAESKLNPTAHNTTGGGHGAAGLFQWRGTRTTKDWNTFLMSQGLYYQPIEQASSELQLKYAVWEMHHGDKGAQRFWKEHANMIEGIEDKTTAFANDFERAGSPDPLINLKRGYAKTLEKQFPYSAGADTQDVLASIDRTLKLLLQQGQKHHQEKGGSHSTPGSSIPRSMTGAVGRSYV